MNSIKTSQYSEAYDESVVSYLGRIRSYVSMAKVPALRYSYRYFPGLKPMISKLRSSNSHGATTNISKDRSVYAPNTAFVISVSPRCHLPVSDWHRRVSIFHKDGWLRVRLKSR
jgi:hypothetical protein